MNRCGFVHMETADMASNAIKALNNTEFKGQTIVVEPGRMKDRNRSTGGAPNKGGSVGRGGMGGNRSDGDRGSNRDGGNRSFNNNQDGGPMRRDRNFQQNRNSGPYQKGPDGQGGGSRFGNGEFVLESKKLGLILRLCCLLVFSLVN